jgi:hypothetical protein
VARGQWTPVRLIRCCIFSPSVRCSIRSACAAWQVCCGARGKYPVNHDQQAATTCRQWRRTGREVDVVQGLARALFAGPCLCHATSRREHIMDLDLSQTSGALVPLHPGCCYQGCPVAGALRRAAQPAGRGRSPRRQGRGWLRARGGPVCLVPARPGREQRLMKRVARTRIVTNRNRGRAKPGPERRRPYWQQQL